MTTTLNKLTIAGLFALFAFGLFFARPLSAQPGYSVPVDAFYNELAPYGQWTQYPGYGNAWIPNAGPNFQPYATAGHWVLTEYGNTWVSDYDWGWAPFHYGRWLYDPSYGGWLWIPDSEWAPAWVSWRSGGGYYGWAPLGPGVNININIPAPYWTFVPQIYITSPNLYGYYAPRNRANYIYQNTTYINNVYQYNNRSFNYGPPRGDIERATRRNVQVYRIEQLNRPGRSVVGNGSVGFYRPDGRGATSRGGAAYGQRYNNGNGNNGQYNNGNRTDYGRNNGSYQGNTGDYNGNSSRGYDNNRDNTPRGNYNGNATPDRTYNGGTTPSRPYDGNATNRDYNANQGRTYDGNATNRGSYNGNQPADQRGNAGITPAPAPDNTSSDRFGRNRGTYSPNAGQSTPTPSPQTNRPFDRSERQGPISSPSAPGGRGSSDQPQPVPDVRSAPGAQPSQAQPQRGEGGNNGGGGRSRGPR